MKTRSLLYLVVGAISLVIGDLFAIRFTRFDDLSSYIFIFIFYLIGMMCLIASYKKTNIAVASTVLVIIDVVILTIVGVLFLNESITVIKVLGLLLGIGAIAILK